MFNLTEDKITGLKNLFGEKDYDTIISILTKLEENYSGESNNDIDNIVKILETKISGLEVRYHELASNTEEPLERLKILSYIIRAIL
jgi:hypothetical protein